MNQIAHPAPRPTAQVAPYVDVLGIDLAVEFLLTVGGAELALARNPGEHSQLVALVGQEKARALAARDDLLQRRVPLAKRWLLPFCIGRAIPGRGSPAAFGSATTPCAATSRVGGRHDGPG